MINPLSKESRRWNSERIEEQGTIGRGSRRIAVWITHRRRLHWWKCLGLCDDCVRNHEIKLGSGFFLCQRHRFEVFWMADGLLWFGTQSRFKEGLNLQSIHSWKSSSLISINTIKFDRKLKTPLIRFIRDLVQWNFSATRTFEKLYDIFQFGTWINEACIIQQKIRHPIQ